MRRSPFGITGDALATVFALLVEGVIVLVAMFPEQLLTPDGLFYLGLLSIWPIVNVLALLGVGGTYLRRLTRDFDILMAVLMLVLGVVFMPGEHPETAAGADTPVQRYHLLIFGSLALLAILAALRLGGSKTEDQDGDDSA